MARVKTLFDKQCKECGERPAVYYVSKYPTRRTCAKCLDAYWSKQREKRRRHQSAFDPLYRILHRACKRCAESPAWYKKNPSCNDGYRGICVDCSKETFGVYSQTLSEVALQKRRAKGRVYHHSKHKATLLDLKRQVFHHYGDICECCGEGSDLAFLTLDHVNNDGAQQRRQNGGRGGTRFYKWLLQNGYPDDLRTLCWTCNMGRYINGGECPHRAQQIAWLGRDGK